MPPDAQPAPSERESDVYGHVPFFDGVTTRQLTIGVHYGGKALERPEDILLNPDGWVLKHPFDHPRMSTEEERAAVGWTW